MAQERVVYEVRNDPAWTARVQRAHMRKCWRLWLGWAAGYLFSFVGSCLAVFWATGMVSSATYSWNVLWTAFFASVVALMHIGWNLSHHLSPGPRDVGEVWTCEITDEAWSFRRRDGLSTSIPWRLMRIDLATPDGWLVNYRSGSVIVFRQPLREAGIEDEFLRRIPARPEV